MTADTILRTILTQVTIQDYADYLTIASDLTVGAYDDEFPKEEAAARADFMGTLEGYLPGADPAGWQEYAVRSEAGVLVGLASFRVITDPAVPLVTSRIGVHLGSAWRGKGYAGRALVSVLCMLRERGAGMAEALIDPDNAPSRRLFERVGFRQGGVLGGDIWYHLSL